MRNRAILFLTMLALSGCGRSTADTATIAKVEAAQRRAADDDGELPCARAGQIELKRDCTVERTAGGEGLILTIRHPDGGFRRLLVTRDGRGVVAADGAEPARIAVLGPDRIQVTIAGDRYVLPAIVKGHGGGQ